MVVRIKFGRGSAVCKLPGKNRHMALALAALLTPATTLFCVLALWRIAADLKWTSQFAIPSGPFSHWQVWIVGAIILQLCTRLLNRYGRGGGAEGAEDAAAS